MFIGNGKINFTVQGEGSPVILIHGIAASAQVWSPLIPYIVQAGYRVFALDLPGHGESLKPSDAGHYHVHEIYSVVEEWIQDLNLEEPITLISHSLGGHLSLKYSLEHSDRVHSMVLIDPYYSPSQLFSPVRWIQSQLPIGTQALRWTSEGLLSQIVIRNPLLGNRLSIEYRRQMAIDLKRASPLILHILPSVADLSPELPEIHTRTLVIWGSRDRTLRANSFQPLVDLLPNSRGVKIPGTGHQPHLSKSDLVIQLVLEFLARDQE
jgi:pimeloyl-ACP methyl ester carboxylesterase